jgi:predicted metalloendopeptidase
MAGRLHGKVALVVGAGSIGPGWGNGKATSALFAREGAKVLCADVNEEAAQETADLIAEEGGTAKAFRADVSRHDHIRGMVQACQDAYGRIDALDWMTAETKAKAREKLRTLYVGVGYPDKWIDYASLQIVKGDALGNLQRAGLFEYRRQIAKLEQPVDRTEWWMTPQTVNALNCPLQNALNFPAAILQPPYFDPARDAAANFGAMGATIGHEISHSFDDQGSQFDAQGRLVNWWTPQDLDHFKAAGEALARQYDAYRPLPDLAINGQQVLSENIADLAGLSAAYDAYHLSLNGKPAADRDFFVSFAQSWRNKAREESIRLQVTTDGHALDEYRAATVRNLDPWYTAFSVAPTQQMYLPPEKRVRVW